MWLNSEQVLTTGSRSAHHSKYNHVITDGISSHPGHLNNMIRHLEYVELLVHHQQVVVKLLCLVLHQ